MARAKQTQKTPRTRSSSVELGDGNFVTDYNPRTGRPIRKRPRASVNSPFVDSAIAVSDEDEDSDDDGGGNDIVANSRSRKRKRSPSPALSLTDHDVETLSDVGPDDDETQSVQWGPACGQESASDADTVMHVTLKDITINIPRGHSGPIVLQLNPTSSKTARQCQPAALTSRPPPPRQSQRLRGRTNTAVSKLQTKSKAQYSGFLDLPAELRNEIYRLAFVAEGCFKFSKPTNFSRSAALLRTCRQVHQEGRSILYSENEFYFSRRTSRYGSFWEDEWRELGFRSVRRFLKTIGLANTALLRHVSFQFEDATPCLNPETMSHEERRFVHDDVLMSILRHLGDHAQLEQFDMNFHGRRRVETSDERFLDYLKRVKADHVRFVNYPVGLQTYYAMESKQEERVKKLLLKTMIRKQKLYD